MRTLAADAVPTRLALADAPSALVGARGAVDRAGRPLLLLKPGEPLRSALNAACDAAVTVNLAVTRRIGDEERPRALLRIQGWAAPVPAPERREAAVLIAERHPDEDLFLALEYPGEPAFPLLARVDVATVMYVAGRDHGTLDAEDYLAAEPDPIAGAAERMLAHVNESHRESLAHAMTHALRRPAPPAEVWLWELDRFGATVQVGPDQIRFPWPEPATCPRALEHALQTLLTP
ncbi:DUF2470 domain-containing protein [Bailinhaonella thermotolerans]|uniref:DUF2470 domain-containing protein n=1 Tax=Bailinhaonella thermotolerans TaxID=1070861 RepID=UPI001F5B619C|nr:DUF2470 domain-containing protein [Bailinhaonella thermotolerans]